MVLTYTVLLATTVVVSVFQALNIGANDVANVIGASIGCKAISLLQLIVMVALFEFIGAVLLGGTVSQRMSIEFLNLADKSGASFNREYMLAMISSLLGSSLWLLIATIFSLPVSTTHSVVGSLIVVGLLMGSSISSINWAFFAQVFASWVLSPVLGFLITMVFWLALCKLVMPHPKRIIAIVPIFFGLTAAIIGFFILYFGMNSLRLEVPLYIAIPVALFIGVVTSIAIWLAASRVLVKRINAEYEQYLEKEAEATYQRQLEKMEKMEKEITAEAIERPSMSSDTSLVDHSSEVLAPASIELNLVVENPQADGSAATVVQAAEEIAQAAQTAPNATNTSNNASTSSMPSITTEAQKRVSPNDVDEQLKRTGAHYVAITEKQAFNVLVVLTSCFIACAHGSNDISNAAGPLSANVILYTTGLIPSTANPYKPFWPIIITSSGLLLGLSLFGYRVMKTVDRTFNSKLTPARAFVCQWVSSLLTLIASALGYPLSTTHIVVGSMFGVSVIDRLLGIIAVNQAIPLNNPAFSKEGTAAGAVDPNVAEGGKIRWKLAVGIGTSWAVTIPIAAAVSLGIFALARLSVPAM